MTLEDLLVLVKRYAKLCILIPVICIIFALGWSFLLQTGYSATASFVTNGDLALAQGLSNNIAASYSNSNLKVSCSSAASSQTIVVTANGDDPNSCIEAANNVANDAIKEYKSVNEGVIASISEASFATSNNSSLFKTAVIAFFAGLLIAFCLIIIIDWVRGPLKSPRDIEECADYPVIGAAFSSQDSERLLANIQFMYRGKPSTVAVVPVGSASEAPIVARELGGAFERADVRVRLVKGSPTATKFRVAVPDNAAVVVSCEPLDLGMGAAYIANNADVTVVCVREWTDSKKQLASTLKELELAKANIVGIAYLPEEKIKRSGGAFRKAKGEE